MTKRFEVNSRVRLSELGRENENYTEFSAMTPFRTLSSKHPESAPDWFVANASGPCSVLIYAGSRNPQTWEFWFGGPTDIATIRYKLVTYETR